MNLEAGADARRAIEAWPGYAATPLIELAGAARRCGVARVFYKDESRRFGLMSFKALGGPYGLQREIERRGGERIVATCATDGNHGRAVAWGARRLGCQCVVHLHAGVSAGREGAIRGLGAEIVRTPGDYDDSVRRCEADARRLGRVVISDTAYPGNETIPRDVMQGYTVAIAEAIEQWPASDRPTHVFIQGGVGGLAAAAIAQLWEAFGADRPRVAIVEPRAADCIFQSLAAGEPRRASGDLNTLMAGLSCGEVSSLAWSFLERGADAAMTIADEAAAEAMRVLADGSMGGGAIVAGESGAAGLAGLSALARDQAARDRIELGADARVLLFGTEGATDSEIYERIVGRAAT